MSIDLDILASQNMLKVPNACRLQVVEHICRSIQRFIEESTEYCDTLTQSALDNLQTML